MTGEEVRKHLPGLDALASPCTRHACIDIWLEMLEQGGWREKGLENCPGAIDPKIDRRENCFEHTRHVADVCLAIADALAAIDRYPACNREDLLAGALVHDVGKLIEYDIDETGAPCKTEKAKYFSHPTTGAYLAKRHGLNDNVVHMILTHSTKRSPDGPNAYNTPESLILKYADELCYKYVEIHSAQERKQPR